MPEDLSTGAAIPGPASLAKAYHQFICALVDLASEAAEQIHDNPAGGAPPTHREVTEVREEIVEAAISALSHPAEQSRTSSRLG